MTKRNQVLAVLLFVLLPSFCLAADGGSKVWTTRDAEDLPNSFKYQGEYAADGWGAQVIALNAQDLQMVLYKGGLPGAGWNGKDKSLFDGAATGLFAAFAFSVGDREYLHNDPRKFSATSKFPPQGQQEGNGFIRDDVLNLNVDGMKEKLKLKRTDRKSPTMGAKPPEGAKVLFDGSNTDEWKGGRLDKESKLLNTDGKDILTKRKLNNYRMHLEFMLPFRPDARGQGRGNSGFYQVDHYEMQILDTFGLEGLDNECGGIYQKANSKVNMCMPPLNWQTYDVEFYNAVVKDGKKVKNARLTAKLNGVVIHDKLEIDGKTGGSRGEPEGTPGSIKLQGHGNPLQFRNIWFEELPEKK